MFNTVVTATSKLKLIYELRRRSVYVRMHDAILTLVGRSN